MEFNVTDGAYSITATAERDSFTLRSCANGTLTAERTLPGALTGMTLDGETLLCSVEYDARAEYKYDTRVLHSFTTRVVQMYRFNMKLEELSCYCETRRVCQHILSCMDESSVYTVDWDAVSTGIEDRDGVFRPFDEISKLIFRQHNFKNCTLTEWTLEDSIDNVCSKALEETVNGYVTGIRRIFASKGKLMLECDAFDPDSIIETDDPESDVSEMDDRDYVEYHSFLNTICVDLDAKELSYVVPER